MSRKILADGFDIVDGYLATRNWFVDEVLLDTKTGASVDVIAALHKVKRFDPPLKPDFVGGIAGEYWKVADRCMTYQRTPIVLHMEADGKPLNIRLFRAVGKIIQVASEPGADVPEPYEGQCIIGADELYVEALELHAVQALPQVVGRWTGPLYEIGDKQRADGTTERRVMKCLMPMHVTVGTTRGDKQGTSNARLASIPEEWWGRLLGDIPMPVMKSLFDDRWAR